MLLHRKVWQTLSQDYPSSITHNSRGIQYLRQGRTCRYLIEMLAFRLFRNLTKAASKDQSSKQCKVRRCFSASKPRFQKQELSILWWWCKLKLALLGSSELPLKQCMWQSCNNWRRCLVLTSYKEDRQILWLGHLGSQGFQPILFNHSLLLDISRGF